MASVEFSMDAEDVQRIQEAIMNFGDGAEQVINDFLKNEANKMFTEAIVNLIPVSDRNKKHAKNSNPIKGEQKQNLALYIHSKTSYNYLYFPDEGEGTSLGQNPHDFMGKGVEAKSDDVVNQILDKLQNNLNL